MKPIIFKHKEDGNWRSRTRDDKGRWRTFKFNAAMHEPGIDGGPPPTVPSGAFKTLPKAIRDTVNPEVAKEPENEPERPAELAQPEPTQTEPNPSPAQAAEVAQPEPEQTPQPDAPEPEQNAANSAFPDFCADAKRAGFVAEASPEGTPQPEPKAEKMDIPVVEMLIDSMFSVGEALGGPKAPPGSSASDGLTVEGLRKMMVKSGKEAFPKAEIEAGPKVTFFGCMAIYLFMCNQHEQFRENAAPWYERAKEKIGLFRYRVKNWFRSRKEKKQPKPEKESKKDAEK